MPVPRHAQLLAGTPVSIILKQDQPTGRQVTGLVADVLTRGDHPRGVKVRLRDGRVGRVQKIVSAAEVGASSSGGGTTGWGTASGGVGESYWGTDGATADRETADGDRGTSNGTDLDSYSSRSRGDRRRGGGRGRYRNNRSENSAPRTFNSDGQAVESEGQEYDLTAFIKDKRKPGAKGRNQRMQEEEGLGTGQEQSSTKTQEVAVVICPVCNDFQGDEAAVEYHVGMHFA